MKPLKEVHLCVIVTEKMAKRPAVEVVRLAIASGADMIQMREKEMSDREFKELALELREEVDPERALFIVNDRVAIARLVRADGVHVGQDDLPAPQAREIIGDEAILGVSTHSLEQARKAMEDGADYIGAGPVFPTATRGYTEGLGTDYLRRVAGEVNIPFLAIGGINLENIDEVIAAGCRRVAVCSAIISSDDIEGTTRRFKERLLGGK